MGLVHTANSFVSLSFSLGLFFHLAHYMKCVAEVSLLQNDYWIIQLGSCQLFQQSLI